METLLLVIAGIILLLFAEKVVIDANALRFYFSI